MVVSNKNVEDSHKVEVDMICFKGKTLNYTQSLEFLNKEMGYIDVENDDTYTKKEIIEVANGHYKDKLSLCSIGNSSDVSGKKCLSCGDIIPIEEMIDYWVNDTNKGMCSPCTIAFIKSNISGGLDCEDLLEHIKANNGGLF